MRRSVEFASRRTSQRVHRARRLLVESLEIRTLLSADFGQALIAEEPADAAEFFAPQARSGRIVIGDDDGPPTAIGLGNGYTGVVELSIGCTASRITEIHYITAEHCTSGRAPADIEIFIHLDNNGFPDAVLPVVDIAELVPTNVLLDGTDVAILTAGALAPDEVPELELSDRDVVGVNATTIGFGFNGIGSLGHGFTSDRHRWAGNNRIDYVGEALDPGGVPRPGTANIYNTDFDDGTAASNTLSPGVASDATPVTFEATTAPGDSGGPLIVGDKIAAVLSGGSSPTSTFGDISWWTGVWEGARPTDFATT